MIQSYESDDDAAELKILLSPIRNKCRLVTDTFFFQFERV
jgi:hypothetical protein